MKKNIGPAICLCLLLLTGACSPHPTPTANQNSQPIQPAIQSISILPPTGGAPLEAIITGSLPNGCASVSGARAVRDGSFFIVFIDAIQRAGGACPASPAPFQETVRLETAGLAPGAYIVLAGASQATFMLGGATAQPTPTQPAPAPSGPPAEAPTATPAAPTTMKSASPSATADVAAAPSATPTGISPADDACIDKAAFDSDVTIPDNTPFRQGDAFTKTWRIRNAGTCAWGPGYTLVFAGGEVMNAPLSSPMPAARPGDFVNVSLQLTAPTGGGIHTGYWEFQNPQGQRFGVNSHGQDLIWVKVAVSWIVLPASAADASPAAMSTPTAASSGSCSAQRSPDFEAQILAAINAARAQAGLDALALNARLSAAALAHSSDMACNDFVDHTGSDGSNWATRIQAQGYAAAYTEENIYVGDPQFGGDAQGAFTWWMNSPVHRANILSPKVTQIGIAYAYTATSTYKGYYTLDFARP